MCHGQGCKGPRINKPGAFEDDDNSVSSCDSFLSLTRVILLRIPHMKLISTFSLKTIHQNRYSFDDKTDGETREIFICFKGSKSTGDLVYGASISHGPTDTYNKVTLQEAERHYATAMSPKQVPSSDEHSTGVPAPAQASRPTPILWCLDKIFDRQRGYLQIRGARV